MATAQNAYTRTQYRSLQARLTAACEAAKAMLDTYSWTDGDGVIHYEVEPVRVILNGEVEQRWSELRAALVIAGQIVAEGQPGPLSDGKVQFLRVQVQDSPVANSNPVVYQFRTVAVFEVLMNVNSYGYADGRAYDIFEEKLREYDVRVLLDTMDYQGRAGYLENDFQGVATSVVIGLRPKLSPPSNLADGWAVISDFADNPEPDFWGLESSRVIIIPTGIEWPQGAQGIAGPVGPIGPVGLRGPQGVRGLQGIPGPGVGGIQAPVFGVGPSMRDSPYQIIQFAYITRENPNVFGGYSQRELYPCAVISATGGDSSNVGQTVAIATFADYFSVARPVQSALTGQNYFGAGPSAFYLVDRVTDRVIAKSFNQSLVDIGAGFAVQSWAYLEGAEGGLMLGCVLVEQGLAGIDDLAYLAAGLPSGSTVWTLPGVGGYGGVEEPHGDEWTLPGSALYAIVRGSGV